MDAQRKALEQLQANVRVLEGKLGEARNKRETLKARAATAKSSKQIQEVRRGKSLRPLFTLSIGGTVMYARVVGASTSMAVL